MVATQARYWLLTIPRASFDSATFPHDPLPSAIQVVMGQLERGASGYEHWQLLVAFTAKKTLAYVKSVFGSQAHCEPTRSAAANEYVFKEDTRIDGC